MELEVDIQKVKQACQNLPVPDDVFVLTDVTIEVYLAKDFFVSTWRSESLQTLVKECRKTFFRYGDVTKILNFDAKSAVYLARATYTVSEGIVCQEWLSFRLVPGVGEPELTEDLKGCSYQGKSLLTLLEESDCINTDKDSLSQVLTLSRLCGIHPYIVGTQEDMIPTKIQYGAALFACMKSFFLDQYPYEQIEPAVITVMFHEPFLDTFMKHSDAHSITFTAAHESLHLDTEYSIDIDRNKKSYLYPGYFLNIYSLLDLLEELIRTHKISDKTVSHHTGITQSISNIREKSLRTVHVLKAFRNLGQLTSFDGALYDSVLTGESLREYIDDQVSDGPKLFILPIETWKHEIASFIKNIT